MSPLIHVFETLIEILLGVVWFLAGSAVLIFVLIAVSTRSFYVHTPSRKKRRK